MDKFLQWVFDLTGYSVFFKEQFNIIGIIKCVIETVNILLKMTICVSAGSEYKMTFKTPGSGEV